MNNIIWTEKNRSLRESPTVFITPEINEKIFKDFINPIDTKTGEEKMSVVEQTVVSCLLRGHSVIYIDSKGRYGDLNITDKHRNYDFFAKDARRDTADPCVSELSGEELKSPGRERRFYHVKTAWNRTMFDDMPDPLLLKFIKDEIYALAAEADIKHGLDIPVDMIIDNSALLYIAMGEDNYRTFLSGFQRRGDWNFKIITGLY